MPPCKGCAAAAEGRGFSGKAQPMQGKGGTPVPRRGISDEAALVPGLFGFSSGAFQLPPTYFE